jgi:hypothetical protein
MSPAAKHLSQVLRISFDTLLKHVEQNDPAAFEFEWDYRWEIDGDIYDPSVEPKKFSLGQLSHDQERLEQIVDGLNPPVGASLGWLAAMLKAIGDRSTC